MEHPKTKGFYILIETETDNVWKTGFSSSSEVVYVARKYKNTPTALRIGVYINKKLVWMWNLLQGEKTMPGFTAHYESNPISSGLPPLDKGKNGQKDGPGKTVIAKLGLPFRIENLRELESTGGFENAPPTFFACDIYFDVTSTKYKTAAAMVELEPGYQMTFSGNASNVKLVIDILLPHYNGQPYYLTLKPQGRSFLFVPVEPLPDGVEA